VIAVRDVGNLWGRGENRCVLLMIERHNANANKDVETCATPGFV
jgi:hypothetical protein